MKVLVTGANGQLGKALAATAPAGARVEAIGRTDLDLADSAAITRLVVERKPDIVFNAAACTAVDKAESEPDLAFAINRDAVAAFASPGDHRRKIRHRLYRVRVRRDILARLPVRG